MEMKMRWNGMEWNSTYADYVTKHMTDQANIRDRDEIEMRHGWKFCNVVSRICKYAHVQSEKAPSIASNAIARNPA